MGYFRFCALIAACLSATSTGCTQSAAERAARTVNVDGSSTVYPLTEAVVDEIRKMHPEVRVTVGFSGTGGGMKKFAAGEIDIADASRPMKAVEAERCAASGIDYVEFKVGVDGLSVVVSPENDWCECLTVDQLKALWRPGSVVRTWSDLDPSWPDETINLFGPGTDSGTFDYFTEAIVGEAKASRSDYTASEDDNVLVTGVQSDPYALGYFGFAYYRENSDRLNVVAVDGGNGCVIPSHETVLDNSYSPLSRPLFVYVSKQALKRPQVRTLVDFYLTNVSNVVADVGYVPVNEDIARENRQKFDEAVAALGP